MAVIYKKHFGFKDAPFSIAPNPRYLYMSEQHHEALAHLLYGIQNNSGFVLLSGEVGSGKTTICRCLLEQIPHNTDMALILNPKLTSHELLATICEEFAVKYPANNSSIKVFVDQINLYLLKAHAAGRQAVLIIDEAQNLSVTVLEQLRLLTNLETDKHKLLQIILLGQPEINDLLAKPDLRQLSQRITARYHLQPLSQKEIAPYVTYRLAVAGASRYALRQIFPAATIKRLFRLSNGVPRLINTICDRALLGAYVQGKYSVDKTTLTKAAREILGESGQQRSRFNKGIRWTIAGLTVVLSGILLVVIYYNDQKPWTDIIKMPITVVDPHKDDATALDTFSLTVVKSEPTIKQPELALLQWPFNQPLSNSKELAYQALFKQWGIDYDPEKNGSACQFAETQNLRCLQSQGSLSSLLHVNRPAILRLYNNKGEIFYATLIAFQEQIATFVMGTETKKVAARDIRDRWYGEYILLWSLPPGYNTAIQTGDQGAVVAWLDKKISSIHARPDRNSTGIIFDSKLTAEIKSFQFTNNLVPDGIVGPQTIIHLNSAAGINVPMLVDSQEN